MSVSKIKDIPWKFAEATRGGRDDGSIAWPRLQAHFYLENDGVICADIS